jgi:hypothetical protein
MELKNIFKTLFPSTLFLAAIMLSCEEIENLATEDIREKIEGQWTCDETSEYFKSTAEIFTVYISPHPDDAALVLIDNMYGLGFDVPAVARISNRNLFINTQNIGDGFTITGSGTISSNFNEINWNYSVDDGSGTIDNVTAVFTRL